MLPLPRPFSDVHHLLPGIRWSGRVVETDGVRLALCRQVIARFELFSSLLTQTVLDHAILTQKEPSRAQRMARFTITF